MSFFTLRWKKNCEIVANFVALSYRLPENDTDAMEALEKENHLLKQQLQNCFTKVAKTQKVMI